MSFVLLPRFVSFWSDFGKRFELSKPISIRSHELAPSKVEFVSRFCQILDHFLVPLGVSHGGTGLVTSPFRLFPLARSASEGPGRVLGCIWVVFGGCRGLYLGAFCKVLAYFLRLLWREFQSDLTITHHVGFLGCGNNRNGGLTLFFRVLKVTAR